MRVLIIGSGGREHALAWKVAQSPKVEQVFVAPGNAGTAQEEKCENVNIKVSDMEGLRDFTQEKNIGLAIVGPEAPLESGIVDMFQEAKLRVFGPTKKAAQLESSKSFAKDFFKRNNIPTAAYEGFSDIGKAEEYIRGVGAPIVIKADGLAVGKGVLVAQNISQAVGFARDCLSGEKFGEGGSSIIVEEFMEGEEATHMSICDGENYLCFPTSQDHKLALDGDNGLNTGGMGAYSPAPIVTEDLEKKIREEIVGPILKGMKEEGNPFVGFLYVGLMIKDGEPRVVEINVRFGDPEAQPIMMQLRSDLVELCSAAVDGELNEKSIDIDPRAAMCVVMASGGYPEKYETGYGIDGLTATGMLDNVKVFHAGTAEKDGEIVTSGGRVLGVTSLGKNIADAQKNTYSAVGKIHWKDEHHRTDIGWRAISNG